MKFDSTNRFTGLVVWIIALITITAISGQQIDFETPDDGSMVLEQMQYLQELLMHALEQQGQIAGVRDAQML